MYVHLTPYATDIDEFTFVGRARWVVKILMQAIDRTSPLPLWAQIENDLRQRLELGEFADSFPSDKELTDHYSVSRQTVRDAIRRLAADGLVLRERGRGTTVLRTVVDQPLGHLYSLFDTIEQAGMSQTSVVRSAGRAVNEAAASFLGLALDTPLFHLDRVRLADSIPLALDSVWIPWELGEPLVDVDWSHTSLYTEMEARLGVRPTSGWERFGACVPSDDDCSALDMDPCSAAFSIERLGGLDSRVIEWRTSLVRADSYHFVTDWQRGEASSARLVPHS